MANKFLMHQYLSIGYVLIKHCNNLASNLEVFVAILEYCTEQFCNAFSFQQTLAQYSGLFFLPMAASLANDESVKCKKLIALAIKSLLGKLDHNARSNLYSIVLNWFMDSKVRTDPLATCTFQNFVLNEIGKGLVVVFLLLYFLVIRSPM